MYPQNTWPVAELLWLTRRRSHLLDTHGAALAVAFAFRTGVVFALPTVMRVQVGVSPAHRCKDALDARMCECS